jgi:hypothetical protein
MNTLWKKTFLVAIPLAGLLLSAPAAEARKHHHHCRPYAERGWYDRGRYNDSYYSWRRNHEWRRPYYDRDYYPSRYPYQPYYGRPYDGGYPWWSVFFDR